MKIVIAPGNFKESLTAPEAAAWIEKGVKKAIPSARTLLVPMADGGAMTVRSLVASTNGTLFRKKVVGPLGEPVRAEYGILGDGATAVIEMSAASGLKLVPPEKRNPLLTTTFGTGQLIEAALNRGTRQLIIGIGDSATVDGGAGMAQALGIGLYNAGGTQIGFGGGNLARLRRIDTSGKLPLLRDASIVVACDVDNPLTGPKGAARVYGPQKGASPAMVERLEKNLRHLARIITRDLGITVDKAPGAGAAGGLGAGLMAFLGARMKLGVEIVAESCRLKEKMTGADLVITGEGKLDGQTIQGKAPIGVARIARSLKIPIVAISGNLTDDAFGLVPRSFDAIFSTTAHVITLDEALATAGRALAKTTEQAMRAYLLGRHSRRRK